MRIVRSIHTGDATGIAPSQTLTKKDLDKGPDFCFRDRRQLELPHFAEGASEVDDPSEGRPRLRRS